VDLNEVVTGLHKMLVRVLGEDVELKVSLAAGLGPVRADRSQLEQVVMNLVVNARDAMPAGGRMTLETAEADLDEAYAREHLEVTPGPHVMLAVSDTGIGMDRATLTRIFEPFFTTKERGKGTGLGLSTVFGIVKQCAGSLWVYSEPGSGSTFKIYLPRVQGQIATTSLMAPRELRGTETILLVEDERQVRAVATEILRRFGYSVLAASGPLEAIALCRDRAQPLHLLLTDVVMPKMNGKTLALEVQQLRPAVRVLYMSGYTDEVISHHGLLERGMAFVQKPLTPSGLVGKVREVLDADRPPSV